MSSGVDPGFSDRGLNTEVISEVEVLHSPLEATGYFINITPKSCLMQDLGHI